MIFIAMNWEIFNKKFRPETVLTKTREEYYPTDNVNIKRDGITLVPGLKQLRGTNLMHIITMIIIIIITIWKKARLL